MGDLTPRAEEVDTLKACINVDDTGEKFRDRLWWTQTGTPFAKQFVKQVKEVTGESCTYHDRGMSQTAGARKPSESQKAKALWAMKAAKDSGEDSYDSAHEENFLGREKRRLELWEEHLKDPIVALDKALKFVENQYQG